MGISAVAVLREIILEAVRLWGKGEWKVLVLDELSKKLVDNVVKEDDILQENVINIELLEQKRPMNQNIDAIYLLTPEPHIVDCLLADFDRRRYRQSYLLWTSPISDDLRQHLNNSANAREQIAQTQVLNIDFFPQESHLITFRDPWSFPTLFHPACNQLVGRHIELLAYKIVSICVSLGEYPIIRYYRPKSTHEANVLCYHLAKTVQKGLDQHASLHEDFPPPSPRPRGVLIVTDRTMDLFAPLIHEFTYQAIVHDLLPVKEADKITYKNILNQGSPSQEEKEMELGEGDRIWVENRHRHMKELLLKLVADFTKFRADHPQFAEDSGTPSSLNNIKDMIAGLPQFQQGKELYTLHLGMAQEIMTIFQKCRLPDIATVEQSLATGLDEDNKKPKSLADQVVRLLAEDDVQFSDRLRLIIEYVLYRDGIFDGDTVKLLAHAGLPARDGEVIHNLELLGAKVSRRIKEGKSTPQLLFVKKQAPPSGGEDVSFSRFEPAIKSMLEEQLRDTLDRNVFPYIKPPSDMNDGLLGQVNVSQASLRSAKPTWARTRPSAMEPRQRIIVFVAGGATYSESRACYEMSQSFSKDIYMASSHMLNPGLFLRQVGDLSVDRRRLDLPVDRPKPQAPAHLFESEQPPTAALDSMNLNSGSGDGNSAKANGLSKLSQKSHPLPSPPFVASSASSVKPSKAPKEKKRGFFKKFPGV